MKMKQWTIQALVLSALTLMTAHAEVNIHRTNELDLGDTLDVAKYDSGWFVMQSQAGTDSYQEVEHNLGDYPRAIKVLVKAVDGPNEGFIFEGSGVQHQDDEGQDEYGGVVFAYNETTVRLWAPSQNNGSPYGAIITVGDGWGGEINYQRSHTAMVRVLAWK